MPPSHVARHVAESSTASPGWSRLQLNTPIHRSQQLLISILMLLVPRPPPPHTLALLLFLAYFLLVLVDVRHHSWRDPGSVFFDSENAFERQYSLLRETEAENFIQNLDENVSYQKAGPEPSLCVGITTVQREGARYFRRALGSVLADLTETERSDIFIMPFIVNPNPTEHQAYNEDWLFPLSDEVLTYAFATEEVKARLQEITADGSDIRRKALFDYIYLLRACHEKDTEWIIMLEDDTVAAEGWYYRTKKGLEDLVGKRDFGQTVYLRLFYNERLLGWNGEEIWTYAIRIVFVEIALLAVLVALARYLPPAAGILTARTIATICFIIAPMLIVLYFAAGRLTVAGPSRGINRMDSYGCCSQAFVFPRSRVPGLSTWYESNADGYLDPVTHADKTQIDSLTEIYATEKGLTRYALTPSVFQHVGGMSTKPTSITRWGRSNAENIWNFSFEVLKKEDLEKQHVG
ncbi:hypothetical protein LTR37_001319 [Vermiconidia calcicola]|uniref:Uncharacterized protein n=1 Tax=Vermiconidia calcicola TaxID=1690605 RepID=A0ACC3NY29_9PEZI|nr:hypothetical protein LTR37_001319 [Vermiconidia calcicola]